MFVAQPEIPIPLAVEFPFPAWATRLSECAVAPPLPASTPANGNRSTSPESARRAGDVFSRLPSTSPDADDDRPPF